MSNYTPKYLSTQNNNEFVFAGEKVVPANADRLLLEDSENDFEKVYLQIANLPSSNVSASSPAGVLTVAPSGAEYDSIQAAMNDASTGQTVLVYPGVYQEDIDFTNVASAIRVTGFPNAQNCIISGSSASSTRVIMSKTATLREITVYGPAEGTNNAISCSLATGQQGVIFNTVIIGGNGTNTSNGVYMTGSGILACIGGLYHNGGTLGGSFVRVDEGSVILQEAIGNIGSSSAFFSQYGGTVDARDWTSQNSLLYKTDKQIEMVSGTQNISNLQTNRILPSSRVCLYIPSGSVTQDLNGSRIFGSEYDFQVLPGVSGEGSELVFHLAILELKMPLLQEFGLITYLKVFLTIQIRV